MKIPKEIAEVLSPGDTGPMLESRLARRIYLIALQLCGRHDLLAYGRWRRGRDGRKTYSCVCGLCGHRLCMRYGARASDRIDNHEARHIVEWGVDRLRVFLAIRALTDGHAATTATCDYPLDDKEARMAFWKRLHEEAKAAKRKPASGEAR